MDWNKIVLIIAQCVVVATMGALVALGHDSAILDTLLAVSGSVAGIGVYQHITKGKE
jgi:hypothetical protein